MELRRLYPEPGAVEIDAVLAELDFGGRAPGDRPFVVANMVGSLDGRAAVHGRAGPLGGEIDRALFHALRRQVDAIMVGTGTLRAERYGRLVKDAAAREARAAAGLRPDPLAVIVSRSLELPLDIPLFQDAESTIAVYTGVSGELEPCPARVHVSRLEGVSIAAALRALRAEHGVSSVLCEGGPLILGAALAEGAIDELFLTLSPVVVGRADEPALVGGQALPEPLELDLRWVLEAGGELFLRYGVQRRGGETYAPR